MAYRELTPQFLKLRAYYVKPQHTSLSPGEDSDDVDVDELTYMNKQKDLENPSLPAYTLGMPEWVRILNDVREDMKKIKKRSTTK